MADRSHAPADEPNPDLDIDAAAPGLDATPDDGRLAARLRSAVDESARPVSLDEVLALVDADPDLGDDDSNGRGDHARSSVTVLGADRGPDLDQPSATPLSGRSRRLPLLLAAAAVVAVLIGVGFTVSRDRSDEVLAGPGETSSGVAPGGIYDPASDLLRDKRVEAMTGAGDLLYLGYVDGAGADPTYTTGDPLLSSTFRYGLLVVDAGDGAAVADHQLDGRPSEWAMGSSGDRVWFVTEGRSAATGGPPSSTGVGDEPSGDAAVLVTTVSSSLWVTTGVEPPRFVDQYQDDVSLAATDGALWVRSFQRLDRRDAGSGDVVESPGDQTWTTDGVVAADGDVVWSTDGEAVVPVTESGRGEPVAVAKLDFAERRLYVADDSLLVVDGRTATRLVSGVVIDRVSTTSSAGLSGVDAAQGRFWLASLDEDPDTSLVDVMTVDAGSGEQRGTQVSLLGERPLITALDDGDAVVCVQAVRTSQDEVPTSAGFGSDCRRVAGPTEEVGPPEPGGPDGTARTTSTASSAEVFVEQEPSVDDATTTTTAPSTSTTTTVGPRAFALNGLTWDGLDPIRLGMTADELTAATGLATRPVERQCGQNGRVVEGLPDGVNVVFNGDDTVRAVTVIDPTFATPEGLTVDSTVGDLLARYPDAMPFDHITAVQYVIAAPDRSRSLFVATEGDDITAIDAAQGDEPFMDLC